MHHHGIHPGLLEQHHVAREIPRDLFVAHGVAAIFDDDDRVVVAEHVRQRLHQDRGLLLRGAFGQIGHRIVLLAKVRHLVRGGAGKLNRVWIGRRRWPRLFSHEAKRISGQLI